MLNTQRLVCTDCGRAVEGGMQESATEFLCIHCHRHRELHEAIEEHKGLHKREEAFVYASTAHLSVPIDLRDGEDREVEIAVTSKSVTAIRKTSFLLYVPLGFRATLTVNFKG